MKSPKSVIISSPYSEPTAHFEYNPQSDAYDKKEGRRPAGYWRASKTKRGKKRKTDEGVFVPLPLVEDIRSHVKEWRAGGYANTTPITRKLLAHWQDTNMRDARFFFCQLEAIETLIWLQEANKGGLHVPGDGGAFARQCAKMATGTGKTIVMAMLIAWQTLNKAAYPDDGRFGCNFLIVAPGLVVRERLRVLQPGTKGNYYDEFNIAPNDMRRKIGQARVVIHNWHTLQWETDKKIAGRKGVDKRGAKKDEAYAREVLGDMANEKNLIVINDEAHHAWRLLPGQRPPSNVPADEKKQATKWMEALDRINRICGIRVCFDFSATPFIPSDSSGAEDFLFRWIVSDFSLSDAIEAGLVKTPRVLVRDDALPDAKTYKSKIYHLFDDPEVFDDLTRANAEDTDNLHDLVRNAYLILAFDWGATQKQWQKGGAATPPTLISVVNHTTTAARVQNAFASKDIDAALVKAGTLNDKSAMLHIDTKTLKAMNEGGKKKGEEELRQKVATVGQEGMPGANICHVISVNMLTEGWDAKTVTHIMGLRPFRSQLLCEQVIGRGLRRTSYDVDNNGMFMAEHVNIFGVPFSFFPSEGESQGNEQMQPRQKIYAMPEREEEFGIRFPNVAAIYRIMRPQLQLDWDRVKPFTLNAQDIRQQAELAEVLERGAPKRDAAIVIKMEGVEQRLQTVAFKASAQLLRRIKISEEQNVSPGLLFAQLTALVKEFIARGFVRIEPKEKHKDENQRALIIGFFMTQICEWIRSAITLANAERLEIKFGDRREISTAEMREWHTAKPTQPTQKSHINRVVLDSAWEDTVAFRLDNNKQVEAWVKNDHLGFKVGYVHNGVYRAYYPDFIVRLAPARFLVLEVKGIDDNEAKSKQMAMQDWVAAVNENGGFGFWQCAQITNVAETEGAIAKAAAKK